MALLAHLGEWTEGDLKWRNFGPQNPDGGMRGRQKKNVLAFYQLKELKWDEMNCRLIGLI